MRDSDAITPQPELLDIGRYPTAVILPGAVVAGLGAGAFLAAWT